MNEEMRTSPLERFVAAVDGWDPADHGGEDEPLESMRERLDAAFPVMLARRGLQAVGEPEYVYQDGEEPFTGRPRRPRLRRKLWVVSAEVPADIVARVAAQIAPTEHAPIYEFNPEPTA